MSHVAYPAFSLDCPKEIIRMVSGRTVRTELKLFAKCVWSITGTALGATIGEPEDVEPIFGSEAVSLDDLNACRNALLDAKHDGVGFGAGEGEGDAELDPATIAVLIQLAITLITKWIERRKQGS